MATDNEVFMQAYGGKLEDEKLEEHIKMRDSSNRLLIHWAALGGHQELIQKLITKGQPVDAEDDMKMTPLILAASAGRIQVVKTLISAGADVNSQNDGGHTALQYAASKGWKDIAELLLSNGANINIQDSQGATPLHRAASKGISPMVSLLLNRPEVEVDICDKYGNTPLHLACEEDRVEEVKMLLHFGANLNIVNKENKSPIQVASTTLMTALQLSPPFTSSK